MSYPKVSPASGVQRQVLAETPELMVISLQFDQGVRSDLHHHPHVQASYVKSGRFRFFVGEREIDLGPGGAVTMPSGVEHGCLCLEAGELVDSFTPRRDDYL